ncbi:MAG: putative Ig domain-containing protein [Bacteroidota bacterium]
MFLTITNYVYGVQASNISVVHWEGQTFITWLEDTTQSKETYKVYRHTAQITAGNLAQATLLTPEKKVFFMGRVKENSSRYYAPLYNSSFESYTIPDGGSVTKQWLLPNVSSPQDPGTEVPVNYGLFVYTIPQGQSGTYYYAVTVVTSAGAEDTAINAGGNSLTAGITESSVQYPYKPILREIVTSGNRIYYYYVHYVDNNYTHFPYLGFEFRLNVPSNYNPATATPLFVCLHNVGAQEWPLGCVYYGSDNMLVLEPTEPMNIGGWLSSELYCKDASINFSPYFRAWWFGYAEEMDITGTAALTASGRVVDYSSRRVINVIDWIKRNYNIDTNRVYLTGSSMGSTGTMLFGLKHPEIFAAVISYTGAPNFNWCPPRGTGSQFNIAMLIGDSSNSLLMRTDVTDGEDNIAAWDYADTGWYAQHYPQKAMPLFYLISNAYDPFWPPWVDISMPVYAKVQNSKHHLFLTLVNSSSHGGSPTGLYHNENSSLVEHTKKSYPAFTYCSLNDDCTTVAPLTSPTTQQYLNWMLNWDESTIVDTADEYKVKVFIRSTCPNDPATVNITPRRLQGFIIDSAYSYSFENKDASNNIVQSGSGIGTDSDGLLTIPNFQISKSGNTLKITKSDMSPVTGTIVINSTETYTSSATVTLGLSASSSSGTVVNMRFSNDNGTWSEFETYATSKAWTLTTGAGAKTVYVKYKDSVGNTSASISDTIILVAPLTITTASPLNSGTAGIAYSASLSATGGTGPYTWTITAGSLPAGLTLSGSAGTISGVASSSGAYTFTIKAQDSTAPTPLESTKQFSITIEPASVTANYKISGYVTTETHQVIADAEVKLDGETVCNTDSDGYYEITGLLAGSYTISIIVSGYAEVTEEVSVSAAAADVNKDIQLSSAGSITNVSKVFTSPNPSTNREITFKNLPANKLITLSIYTLAGVKIFEKSFTQATNEWEWDCKNQGGEKISRGLYIYVIKDGNTIKKGKIVIK